MSHIYLTRPLTAPDALRRMTHFQGPDIVKINQQAEKKLEIAEDGKQAVNELVEQKLSQNGALIQALEEENRQMMLTLRNVTSKKPLSPYFKKDPQNARNPKFQVMTTRECNDAAQSLNLVVSDRKKYEQKLNKLEDQYRLTLQIIDRPEPVVERALVRVRELENKLDDANIRKKEAYSIQDTYNTIVNRLKIESLRFEKEIEYAVLQTNLQMRDQAELDQYLRESIEAASAVNFEYVQLNDTFQEMRSSWQDAIKGRREQVEEIIEREKRIEKERQEQRMLQMNRSDEMNTDSQLTDFDDLDGSKLAENERANLQYYRQRFGVLKGLLGIENLNQFKARLVNQKQQQNELIEQQQVAHTTLLEINDKLSKTRQKLTDVVFSIESNANRKQLDKINYQIAELRHKNSALQQQFNREESKFSQLLRGLQHIFEQVQMFKTDITFDKFVDENLTPQQKIELITQKFQILLELSGNNQLDLVMSTTQNLTVRREQDAVDLYSDDWLVQDPTWAKILNPQNNMQQLQELDMLEQDQFNVKRIDDDFDAARLRAKQQSRKIAETYARREEDY